MLASPICWGSSLSGSRHPSLSISVQKLERKYFHAVISKEFHVIYWPSLKISCTKCQRKYCIKTVRLTNIAFLTLTVLRFFCCSLLQRGAIKIKSEFFYLFAFFLLLTVEPLWLNLGYLKPPANLNRIQFPLYLTLSSANLNSVNLNSPLSHNNFTFPWLITWTLIKNVTP